MTALVGAVTPIAIPAGAKIVTHAVTVAHAAAAIAVTGHATAA